MTKPRRFFSADSHCVIKSEQVKKDLASKYHDAWDTGMARHAVKQSEAQGGQTLNLEDFIDLEAARHPGYYDPSERLKAMITERCSPPDPGRRVLAAGQSGDLAVAGIAARVDDHGRARDREAGRVLDGRAEAGLGAAVRVVDAGGRDVEPRRSGSCRPRCGAPRSGSPSPSPGSPSPSPNSVPPSSVELVRLSLHARDPSASASATKPTAP